MNRRQFIKLVSFSSILPYIPKTQASYVESSTLLGVDVGTKDVGVIYIKLLCITADHINSEPITTYVVRGRTPFID